MSKASHGSFIWFDLLTTNPKAAIEFYAQVAGWKPQPFETGIPYTMFVGAQGPLGGVTDLPQAANQTSTGSHWTANVYVDDVDAACVAAKRLGGRVLVEPGEFPKVGRMAVIADPQGATTNLFKPNDAMELHDPSKPGEFTWCELLTTDHESAFAFYRQLFGWKKSRDFDMGRDLGNYLIYTHASGGRDCGGMFTKGKDMPMPPMWFHYIEVAGLDAAIERATRAGGKVMNGPMEVPGGARIAQLTDPQGAAFALHEEKTK
jgi:predicted enzyme related to lactoylglutathione lyase